VVINDTMLTDGGWLVVELVMDEGPRLAVDAVRLQKSTSKRTIQHTLSRLQCRYYNVEGS
jgi:hypothetical protein